MWETNRHKTYPVYFILQFRSVKRPKETLKACLLCGLSVYRKTNMGPHTHTYTHTH